MKAESDKTRLRRKLVSTRETKPATEKRLHSERICAAVLAVSPPPASVFVYVSLPDEVATRTLIDTFVARGATVTVPRIVAGGEMRAVSFPGWEEMRAGPLGIPAPSSRLAYNGPIESAIVPGLGFTRDGARIGYGAGYYDRWLASHPHTARIGVAFECQLVAMLPQEAHDVPMHRVITETGVYPESVG